MRIVQRPEGLMRILEFSAEDLAEIESAIAWKRDSIEKGLYGECTAHSAEYPNAAPDAPACDCDARWMTHLDAIRTKVREALAWTQTA